MMLCAALVALAYTHGTLSIPEARLLTERWRPVVTQLDTHVTLVDSTALRRHTRMIIALQKPRAYAICGISGGGLTGGDSLNLVLLTRNETLSSVEAILWGDRNMDAHPEHARALCEWHRQAFGGRKLIAGRGLEVMDRKCFRTS